MSKLNNLKKSLEENNTLFNLSNFVPSDSVFANENDRLQWQIEIIREMFYFRKQIEIIENGESNQ